MNLQEEKQRLDNYLNDQLPELWSIAQYVHANPELAYEEFKACEVQCQYLEKLGFKVERNIGGLPTAYQASFGQGKPEIAILAEYDALPELGHGCGHNLICTSALGAGAMVKNFLENNEVKGTVKVIGTPAEESGGGKIQLLEEGVFEGIDAVIMQHPTSAPSRLAGECMSSKKILIEFYGKSAHAGSHPENGTNALSAANLFFAATGFLRQQFKGDMRFNGIIADGGKGTGLIPDYAKIIGSASAFNLKELNANVEKIENCAKGSALSLGCEVKFEAKDGYLGRIPNATLSNSCREELKDLNEPLLDGMPFDYGGEDLGNISRVIPICNPYITIYPECKISNHTPQFRDLANSDRGKHCLEIASKAMGRTVVSWFVNPVILQNAKDELASRMLEQ